MEQNKTGRYLKYAIGEIILVVIGILIALQINNWNNNQITKQKEARHLINLERDFKLQLDAIEQQQNYEKEIFETTKPLIDYYKKHHEFLVDSSFSSKIGKACGRKTFVNHSATYTELLTSGAMDVLSDDQFKNELIRYYQQLEVMEKIINKNNNLFVDAVFIPEVMKISEIRFAGTLETILGNANVPDGLYAMNGDTDLNEAELLAITKELLEIPEKRLLFINALNFRHHLTIVHHTNLAQQKQNTERLLNMLKHND